MLKPISSNYLQGLTDDLERKMNDFWNCLDFSKPYECKQAIMAYFPKLIYKYARLSARAAANYFNSFNEINETNHNAEPYMCETLEDIEKRIDYSCRLLFGEDE